MLYQILWLYGADLLRARSACVATACSEAFQQRGPFDLSLRLTTLGQRRFEFIRRGASLLEAREGILESSLPIVRFSEQVLYGAPAEDNLLTLLDVDKNGLLEMTVRALVFFSNYGCTASMNTLLMYFSSRYNNFFTITRDLYEDVSKLKSAISSRENRVAREADLSEDQIVQLENLSVGGLEYLKSILLERGRKISDQTMISVYKTLAMPLRETVKDPQRFYTVFRQYGIEKPERCATVDGLSANCYNRNGSKITQEKK